MKEQKAVSRKAAIEKQKRQQEQKKREQEQKKRVEEEQKRRDELVAEAQHKNPGVGQEGCSGTTECSLASAGSCFGLVTTTAGTALIAKHRDRATAGGNAFNASSIAGEQSSQ